MSEKIRIAVFFGGTSREREVSLSSGKGVSEALKTNSNFEVITYDPKTDLQKFVKDAEDKKIDVVFPILHGRGGEDGAIQGLCELLSLPYVGSGIRASANAMDKITAKDMYRTASIPVADDICIVHRYENHFFVKNNISSTAKDMLHRYTALEVKRGKNWRDLEETEINLFEDVLKTINESPLDFPVVVKPSSEGSSFGVFLVNNEEELKKSLLEALAIDRKIIIESYLRGKEITVGVIGSADLQVFEPIEIVPQKGQFYDYESKYAAGGSDHIIPARISEQELALCKKYALMAHKTLGCRHFSRTDMFVTEQGVFVTETNTIPGFTPTSLLPDGAKYAGISYEQLCEKLIYWALEEKMN